MSLTITNSFLWIAAISSGIMAGVYFTFSSFVMRAFDNIDHSHSITAMNTINKIILSSSFMPLFFGSSIISIALVISGIINWSEAWSGLVIFAGAVYFVGMFVCTAAFNVPLNNSLAVINQHSDGAERTWSNYYSQWTRWNHLRTICSLTSFVVCIWLLTNYSF